MLILQVKFLEENYIIIAFLIYNLEFIPASGEEVYKWPKSQGWEKVDIDF